MDYTLNDAGEWVVNLYKRHEDIRDRRGSTVDAPRPSRRPTAITIRNTSGSMQTVDIDTGAKVRHFPTYDDL